MAGRSDAELLTDLLSRERRLVSAYEAAMRELNIPGPTASGAETLAMTIIRFAKQGERDPVRLRERAIDALSRLPPEAADA